MLNNLKRKNMKYLIKAVSTNTKDCKTGLMVSIDDTSYTFNTPDGY